MNKRTIVSAVALLCTISVLAIVCSTLLSGSVSSQQPQYAGSTTSLGSTSNSPVIQGLEGLKGFGAGHSHLSLAVIPLSQQNSQLAFQVIGFAVSIPETGEAVVYSMKTPMQGIIDPSQNTMQIDISGLGDAVNTAGYIDSSQIYDTIRTDPRVMVIDIDLTSPSKQGSQTTFNVNSVDIVPPDGKMQAFSMQQPTQLIIDTQSNRVAMVAFPEMTSALDSYYGAEYTQVEPVVYAQPIPVAAPVFVPYVQPLPFFATGFVTYNPFYYGYGYRSFFERNRYTDRDIYSNNNRYPIRDHRNDYADRARNDLVTSQKRGDFNVHRNVGTNINGGIGGYRGGVRTSMGSMGTKVGGGVSRGGMGGGRAGGGRR